MTHYYAASRLGTLLFALFFAQTLTAQWESAPAPGTESVHDIFSIGNSWVAFTASGCYHSADDGISWRQTLALDGYDIAVNKTGADLYAISNTKGLYSSSDEGQTWNLLTANTPGGNAYPDGISATDNYILFETYNALYRYDKANPGNPTALLNYGQMAYPNTLIMKTQGNDVWVAVNDSLLHSADEGNSWSLVFEGWRASSMAVQGDTIMLTTAGGVERSVNKGMDWTSVFAPGSPYGVYADAGLWFVNTSLGNGQSLQSSSDGGITWHAFSDVLDKNYTYKLVRKGNTLLANCSAGIARSTDGAHWELRNTGLGSDDFSSWGGRIATTGSYLSLLSQFSEDNGETWFSPLNDATSLDYPLTAFKGNYYAIDYNAKLYRSLGNIRDMQETGVTFTAGLGQELAATDNHLYRLEYDGWNNGPVVIYESTDEGLTWTPTGGEISYYTRLVVHGDYLFEWRGGYGLFRSPNGGVTWESVGAGLTELAQFNDEATLYSDGIHLFAYNYNAIMVSSNNGLTFTKISNHLLGPSGYPTGADKLASDGNTVVVLNYQGIYLSEGLNDQWYEISANLPNTDFYDEELLVHNGYIWLDYNYGPTPLWRRTITSVNLAQFDGKVWRDDNNNGQEDPGEQPFQGGIVRAGTGSYTTTSVDGVYGLFADLNNDTLRVKKPAPWVVANPEFYQVTASETGKNFGLYFPPNITDLRVELTNETVFRPGFNQNIYLSYYNQGTADADGTIRFVPESPLEFQSAYPAPDATSGDTLIWNFQNFVAFSEDKIVINVKVPATAPLGSIVGAYADINPAQPDANPADNQSFLHERVFGSYDPNDKRCDPETLSPEEVQSGKELIYTVRFQNTGTYPAEFVRIADTLDFGRLDVSTFKVLASSHPCQTTLRGSGEVEFFFDQIDLPPSEFNEPASHGFIKYSIQPKATLALGQQIHNTAYIYFDYNAPIVTNTTLTGVAVHVGTTDINWAKPEGWLLVSPNPTTGLVQVETGESVVGSLRVFDALGKLAMEQNGVQGVEKLDLSLLTPGHYTLEWRSTAGKRKIGRVVRLK